MKIFNVDYKKYIKEMEEKDIVIIDPPWNYNININNLKRYQLYYDLWGK